MWVCVCVCARVRAGLAGDALQLGEDPAGSRAGSLTVGTCMALAIHCPQITCKDLSPGRSLSQSPLFHTTTILYLESCADRAKN